MQIHRSVLKDSDQKARGTELRLVSRPFVVTIRIQSSSSGRVRRQLALLLFRHLRPAFEAIQEAVIDEDDPHFLKLFTHLARTVTTWQACHGASPQGKLGFGIRFARLKSGLTQAELAQKSGIAPTHLSRIEKGLCTPRITTIQRIQAVLGDLNAPLRRPLAPETAKIKSRYRRHWSDPGFPPGWYEQSD